MKRTPQSTGLRQYPLLLLLLLLPGLTWAGPPFDRIVAFGDSLADSGNVFILTGEIAHKPYEVIPSAPYPIGGLQFSNGPTWVEQLAAELRLGPSANPALRAPGVFSNYAFGGARARDAGVSPSLTTQIGLFLADHGGQASPDALYALSIGGNDLRDAAVDPGDATAIIGAAVQSIADNLQLLVASGARHFLVANQPNLSVVPAITLQNDPALSAAALQASLAFNQALEGVLSALEGVPGVRISRIDGFALTTQLAQDPTVLGIDDASTPCLRFGIMGNAICRNRDGHFYWDGIHPTRAGHALIARLAMEALALEAGP